MPEREKSVREIQDECAQVAGQLDALSYQLTQLRDDLRLPADAAYLYEGADVPWPVELEIDAVLGVITDDHLDRAAAQLRKVSRVTSEQLRQRFIVQRLAQDRQNEGSQA